MATAQNLVGQKYGRLTVIERIGSKTGKTYWHCVCDCGGTKNATAGDMRFGRTLSCGCLRKESLSKISKTHGMTKSRIYQCWSDMMTRCRNSKDKHYKWYGARGIMICEKWLSFDGFYEDMQDGYADDLTLDRIDVDGNYEKSNCKWSTVQEQCDNRRSNHYITYQGITDTLTNTCKRCNVSRSLVTDRLKTGWDVKSAIERPPQPGIKLK